MRGREQVLGMGESWVPKAGGSQVPMRAMGKRRGWGGGTGAGDGEASPGKIRHGAAAGGVVRVGVDRGGWCFLAALLVGV
jgi:hypothetical protein